MNDNDIKEFDDSILSSNHSFSKKKIIKPENTSKRPKIIDIGDNFDSSSDDEIQIPISENTSFIAPPINNHTYYSIFGPIHAQNDISSYSTSSSDSDDDAFEFKFNPSPQRFQRRIPLQPKAVQSNIMNNNISDYKKSKQRFPNLYTNILPQL